MIVFENAGEIDIRLATLIGVNVKEGTNPVGFFGTGLKYAIASLLRWNNSITIQSGVAEFVFVINPTTLRGKSFDIITMHGQHDKLDLGFTTELGKRWEPWMIYRELWCNAHDEPQPRVFLTGTKPKPLAGTTRVIVTSEILEEAHNNHEEFILFPKTPPLHTCNGVEIYSSAADKIFYRNIAVQSLSKPSLYTFNITRSLALTEDRTAGTWSTMPLITNALCQLEDEALIRETLLAPAESFESSLDYDYVYPPTQTWLRVAKELADSHPLQMPATARRKVKPEQKIEICPTCGREKDV